MKKIIFALIMFIFGINSGYSFFDPEFHVKVDYIIDSTGDHLKKGAMLKAPKNTYLYFSETENLLLIFSKDDPENLFISPILIGQHKVRKGILKGDSGRYFIIRSSNVCSALLENIIDKHGEKKVLLYLMSDYVEKPWEVLIRGAKEEKFELKKKPGK